MGFPTILTGKITRKYHRLMTEDKPILGQYRVLVYASPHGGVGYGNVCSIRRNGDLEKFSRRSGSAIYAIKVRPK